MEDAETVPPFAIQPVLHRGLGMVATQNMDVGTKILQESPLFFVPTRATNVQNYRKTLSEQIKKLNRDKQRDYLSLHNAYAGDPIVNITRTNGIPVDKDERCAAIFLQASRINHSCRPNALHTYSAERKQLVLHAIKDIKAGDEITITYIWATYTFAVRQWKLQDSFGFQCACDLCSLPLSQRIQSDKRLDTIIGLDDDLSKRQDRFLPLPLACLRKADRILELLMQQDLPGVLIGRTYGAAFAIAAMHGDAARASVFGKRQVVSQIVCHGEDNAEVPELQARAVDPATSEGFGRTSRWASTLDRVPKEFGEKEFEDWLWRRND